MKLVREHINEKFTQESDPIKDLGIGSIFSKLKPGDILILEKDLIIKELTNSKLEKIIFNSNKKISPYARLRKGSFHCVKSIEFLKNGKIKLYTIGFTDYTWARKCSQEIINHDDRTYFTNVGIATAKTWHKYFKKLKN